MLCTLSHDWACAASCSGQGPRGRSWLTLQALQERVLENVRISRSVLRVRAIALLVQGVHTDSRELISPHCVGSAAHPYGILPRIPKLDLSACVNAVPLFHLGLCSSSGPRSLHLIA